MIYIIDHQDSFTWNIVHQFSMFDRVYCSNYFEINQKKLNNSDTIILSPGPGSPKDYPLTSKIYKKYKGKKKIIGICLGYQQILFNEKGKIVKDEKPIKETSKKSKKITNNKKKKDLTSKDKKKEKQKKKQKPGDMKGVDLKDVLKKVEKDEDPLPSIKLPKLKKITKEV